MSNDCPHARKTPTTVGGWTCDRCGEYLWDHSRKARAIVASVLCRFDYEAGKWVPLVTK